MKREAVQRLTPWLVLAGGLTAWEAGARAGLVPALFFPAPSEIALALAASVGDGSLPMHTAATLFRLAAGLAIGGVAGVVAGTAIGWFPAARRMLDPLVASLHPLPKVALLPLLMVMLGIGEWSKIAAIALAAFFPMVISTGAGIRHIPHGYYEVVESHGGGRGDVFRHVVLPGMLPMTLAGLRVALNTALTIVVAVELVAAERGLGRMIWSGWQSLRTERLWAGLAVIGAIGVLTNAALDALTRSLVRWQPERE